MPNPTPSLETGWGKSAAAGSVATAPGEGARPCLRHSVPTGPCAPPWVPSGSWRKKNYLGVRPSRKPKGSEHAQPHVPPSLSPRPSIGSARGARRRTRRSTSEDHSIGPTEGGSPGSGSGRQGNRPESIYTTGGGAAPGVSPPPDAHIRAQEGVGPALSRGPEPGTGSPGICQVPGRARAPGWLVPTSLAAAPGAPTADWLGPTQLLWGRVLPGRPSPAGPRLPAGLGRTSPPARRGAEGRASASRRPGAWAGWHDWMPPPSGGVPFLSARRSGAPPP